MDKTFPDYFVFNTKMIVQNGQVLLQKPQTSVILCVIIGTSRHWHTCKSPCKCPQLWVLIF